MRSLSFKPAGEAGAQQREETTLEKWARRAREDEAREAAAALAEAAGREKQLDVWRRSARRGETA